MTLARENIAKYDLPQVEVYQSSDILGFPEHAPYDRILVSAATDTLPNVLLNQLKVGGTMVIPLGQSLCRVTRPSGTRTETERFKGFSFVPLIH